jgi:4-amino-4-deoxy-L-arabinose transferase-like glycosyltransferase
VNKPNPALVTQRGARALPRVALWLLCAAYVLPGVFGRDPWRNADLAAYGQMFAMATGRTSWWAPTLGGVAGDTALLPHWLGAGFITLLAPLSPWVDTTLAARLPFALLLALALVITWYATYHLARTEAAQPLAFAFGGEAEPVDYARAIADGAVLAFIATLGLLQLGHETTPELAQLAATALYSYGLAAAPSRAARSRWAVLLALPLLAGSGAPAMALLMGLGGVLVTLRSRYPQVRPLAIWVVAAMVLATAVAHVLGTWRWRTHGGLVLSELPLIARQWAWFLWPAWLLALWTLWRWRRQLSHRHISVPLVTVLTALIASVAMNGFDRALLLSLPGLAMLAAFALPTLKRSTAAAVDWFSMLLFTLGGLFFWVMYVSLHTGVPAQPKANVLRFAQGFVPVFSWPLFLLAVLATLAWIWLVRWRTGRHREALWKSLVLPAGGVTLCWALAMTLWLPFADYARSARPLVERVARHVPKEACIATPEMNRATVAALEDVGGWRVDARPNALQSSACSYLLRTTRAKPVPRPPAGWERVAEVLRPTDREELTLIDRRIKTP